MSQKNGCPLALCLVLLIALALPLQNSSAKRTVEEPNYGGTLRVMPFTEVFQLNLDPAKGPRIFVTEQIYDGLVRLDQNLNVIPSLAEYWVISEDGKKSIFYLRKGVKFHHGRELDAEDVKFSLERLVNKETAGPYCQYFTTKVVGAQEYWEGKAKDVEGFKARDKYTFEIQWRYPYVSSLYLLSMNFCKILPRDLVLDQGSNFFFKPSGTGPFKFDYWLRSPKLEVVGVRLKRNNDYFGKKSYLEAIEFSPHYTLDHFLRKEIDIIPYVSERLSDMDCQVLENESFITMFLGMSCDIPPLDRQAVRRAISLGIDKKEIAKAAFRFDTVPQVTNNFIPAKLPGFFPVDDKTSYNPEEAGDILRREGFFDGSNFPPLTLFFEWPRRDDNIRIYRVLSNQLAGLGIKSKMKYYKSIEELKPLKEPYLIMIDWMMDFPDPENIILPLFFSSSIVNLDLLRYSNRKLDELAKRAEVERSWKERISLFHKIEEILYADIPALPLFSRQQRLALQPYIRGAKIPPLGFFYLDAKEIWLAR